MIQPKQKNRLCIYFFYDKDGIVDDYVINCIKDLKKNITDIVVVCNGLLSKNSKERFFHAGVKDIFMRQNTGFDVWAYKHAIDTIGWTELSKYYEVILMNFTIMGPVYPFSEMFEAMDSKESLDFWGITTHHGEPYDPWGLLPEGYIPLHLQSHFIAFRNKFIVTNDCQKYWDTVPQINSYIEAIACHEAIFTQHFERLGYTWASYINSNDLAQYTSYPLMFMPLEMIKDKRCPIFKRKAFLLPLSEYLACSNGSAPSRTLEFLEGAGFDVSTIFKNINRYGNQFLIRTTSNQFIPIETGVVSVSNRRLENSLFFTFIDNEVSLGILEKFINPHDPPVLDICIAATKKMLRATLELYGNTQHIKIKEVSCTTDAIFYIKNISSNYGFIGIAGFNSPLKKAHSLLSYDYLRSSMNTIFAASDNFSGVLNIFNKTYIGAIAPSPSLNTGQKNTWDTWDGDYFKSTEQLIRILGLNYKDLVKQDMPPLASFGGFYWIRASILSSIDESALLKASQKLSAKRFCTSFYYAIPFIVQAQGMLCVNGMLPKDYSNYISTSAYTPHNLPVATKPLPINYAGTLYWKTASSQFSENRKYTRRIDIHSEHVNVSFTIRRAATSIRFDPLEGSGVICRGIVALVNGSPVKITPLNAISFSDQDIFLTRDPQYEVHASVAPGDIVTIQFTHFSVYDDTSRDDAGIEYIDYPNNLKKAFNDMLVHYEQSMAMRAQDIRQSPVRSLHELSSRLRSVYAKRRNK